MLGPLIYQKGSMISVLLVCVCLTRIHFYLSLNKANFLKFGPSIKKVAYQTIGCRLRYWTKEIQDFWRNLCYKLLCELLPLALKFSQFVNHYFFTVCDQINFSQFRGRSKIIWRSVFYMNYGQDFYKKVIKTFIYEHEGPESQIFILTWKDLRGEGGSEVIFSTF